jgi:hypothetical protein
VEACDFWCEVVRMTTVIKYHVKYRNGKKSPEYIVYQQAMLYFGLDEEKYIFTRHSLRNMTWGIYPRPKIGGWKNCKDKTWIALLIGKKHRVNSGW